MSRVAVIKIAEKNGNRPCFLRLGDDYLDDAEFCVSLREAKDRFLEVARDLDRFGQAIEATLHLVSSENPEPDEYPDFTLTLGPRGGTRITKL